MQVMVAAGRGPGCERLRKEDQLRNTPPPPPPPQLAPTASLTANPNTITPGQSTTLTWSTEHATDVTIDQLGKVDPSGSRTVQPGQSTTYHLVAKNAVGTQEATARVTVVQSPPPPPPAQTSDQGDAQLFTPEHAGRVLRLRQL